MEIEKEIQKIQNNLTIRDFKTAFEKSNKLIKKFPNNSFIYNLAGLALLQSGNFKVSINYLERALVLNNKNLSAKNNLSNAYKALGKFDISFKLYKEILIADPQNIKCLNNFGNLKQQLNDFDGAINLYKQALDLDPENIIILISLASSYNSLGHFNEALHIIDKILKIDLNVMLAHKIKSSLIDYKLNKEHLDQMLKLLQEENLQLNQISDLNFAIGKAYEDREDYQNSFKHFENANNLKNQYSKFDINKEIKLFTNIKDVFKNINLNTNLQFQNESKIIFILGMPRSGTTLVEQIIASHNDVYGSGELVYLDRIINNTYIKDNSLDKRVLLEDINFQRTYLNNYYFKLIKLHKTPKKVLTDKAPQNFRWIGFIKIFFPKAKIIHCVRNPKDTCLSLFKNDFPSTDMKWTNSEENIARYYNMYKDLMEFWKSKTGNFIYDLNYEKLVKNKEHEVKSLLKFCELEFDKSCLNHHKNLNTPIKTVSISQARKPIYNNSVNKSEYYKNNLNHMFSLLE